MCIGGRNRLRYRSIRNWVMSALGHSRLLWPIRATSAYPLIATGKATSRIRPDAPVGQSISALPSRLDAICTANGDGIATSMSISRTVFSILVCRATAGQLADNGASVLCCGSEGDFGPLYTQTMVSPGNMRHVEGTGRSLRTLPLNRRRVDWESSFSRERCRYEWACSA